MLFFKQKLSPCSINRLEIVPEFPIETSDGVKVADIGLLTIDQAVALKNNVTSAFAPVLCVEVLSPSNTLTEMQYKKGLYFETLQS